MTKAVVRAGDGAVICERCAIADTAWSRMRGLLGRRGLASDEGMLLRPTPSVMTFFMRFPIDVVFLDRDGVVLAVRPEVRPWRAVSCRRARSTLELRAGEAAARGLRSGDVLSVQ
jgi:uncharacterized membrane protein (UPF0127 family)